MTTLSKCQRKALDEITKWWLNAKANDQFFLSGAAGTGKTWLIQYLCTKLLLKPIVFAPTNKACRVLEKNNIPATTIHSALYYPPKVSKNKDGEISLNFEYQGIRTNASIVIIDEVSMIGLKVGKDISRMLKECKLPILLIGDIHQLPPVNDVQWAKYPNYEMKTLLRQSLQNAPNIINLATKFRENKIADLDCIKTKDLVVKRIYSNNDILDADIILTRTHAIRRYIISKKRRLLQLSDIQHGEPIFILKNDYRHRIFNGQEFKFHHRTNNTIAITDDEFDDPNIHIMDISHYIIEDLYDREAHKLANYTYGYATTVHKSQGSEWDTVLLLESCNRHPNETSEEYRKWMYTAITRAKKKLIIA